MNPILKGSITGNISFLTNASNETFIMSTIGAGSKIENNGYYGMVECGYGEKAKYVKAELGKDFAFGDNGFGMNTSVGGQYTVSNHERDYYRNVFKDGNNSPTWKANDTRGYGQIALTYNNQTVDVGLGVRAGVKTSTQPSLDGITLADIGDIRGTEYAGRTTKSFVELRPSVGVNLGKGWKIALQTGIDKSGLNNGQLGLSLNF